MGERDCIRTGSVEPDLMVGNLAFMELPVVDLILLIFKLDNHFLSNLGMGLNAIFHIMIPFGTFSQNHSFYWYLIYYANDGIN